MAKITYPCILEVSQSEDFSQDPMMKKNKFQVCIGKVGGKYICIDTKEEIIEWTLNQFKQAINSGAVSGLTLSFWNYARKIN